MTPALWAIAAAILFVGLVIARIGYVWATTSQLDRPLSEAEIAANLAPKVAWNWPTREDDPEEGLGVTPEVAPEA